MNTNAFLRKNKFREESSFTNRLFKGFGQIMLQENAVTGMVFLAGICFGSVSMGVAALLAAITGTLTAIVLKFPSENINKGLYGFSAALTGVAFVLFFNPGVMLWMMVVVGAVLSACIQHFFIRQNIPVFTLPFVMVTWFLVFVLHSFFPASEVAPSAAEASSLNYFIFPVKGFGQVIFQNNIISGLLFILAVAICSPVAAIYGMAGSLLSGLIALYLFDVPQGAVADGLFSFNAVLCAIAFSGKQFKNILQAAVAVLLSLVISIKMSEYNLLQLTFPFVAATVLVISLQKIIFTKK